jgi:Adenylate cyclase regulatory domain
MPIDFEAEGLLDDLEDPHDRAERVTLLQHLLRRGVPPGDLRSAATDGRLVMLAVERALDATGEEYTLADVAANAGLDVEVVRRLRASLASARTVQAICDSRPSIRRRSSRARRRARRMAGHTALAGLTCFSEGNAPVGGR